MPTTDEVEGLDPRDAFALLARYSIVQRFEEQGATLVVHMRTSRGEGTCRVPLAGLVREEARDLVENAIRTCPFAA